MTAPICPVCTGPTHEIRAKLVCRQCGMILETCCEGGPMSGRCEAPAERAERPAVQSSRPDSSDDFSRG